jgi:mannosyl-oligosaccharide glucosidase
MIFNLYGGQAFYYGILYTQNSLLNHELDYSYTFTPSRLIFPRGFLWDDGFHMSVAVHHNSKIVLNIIHNWFKKIDLFGWIGREQIRGYEMSSLMPEIKFVYQDIFEMNPPTLILPILSLIEKSKNNELSKI